MRIIKFILFWVLEAIATIVTYVLCIPLRAGIDWCDGPDEIYSRR
jgi:hypothetical protein